MRLFRSSVLAACCCFPSSFTSAAPLPADAVILSSNSSTLYRINHDGSVREEFDLQVATGAMTTDSSGRVWVASATDLDADGAVELFELLDPLGTPTLQLRYDILPDEGAGLGPSAIAFHRGELFVFGNSGAHYVTSLDFDPTVHAVPFAQDVGRFSGAGSLRGVLYATQVNGTLDSDLFNLGIDVGTDPVDLAGPLGLSGARTEDSEVFRGVYYHTYTASTPGGPVKVFGSIDFGPHGPLFEEEFRFALSGNGLNGMAIVAIPEPTTSLLIAGSLLAIAARRRSSI